MTYGCHNTERMPAYYAANGTYIKSKHPHEMKEIRTLAVMVLDRSSKECRYDKRAEDKRCAGCNK
jgi:hypothetical protein